MAIFRNDPYPCMNFEVQLGNASPGATTGVLEVLFPEARIDSYEYRNGNDPSNAGRSLQTIIRYGRLVLRRGANGSLDWFQWWQTVSKGTMDRRTVSVNLFDEAHNGPVLSWIFSSARPMNYGFSPLNALGTGGLVESLELAFDDFVMQ